MPQRPSHRLDLVIVSDDLHGALPTEELITALQSSGIIDEGGRPGANAQQLVSGGFQRIWVDIPPQMVLYANQQGGYYVRCPKNGDNVVPSFQRALRQWRAGGPRELTCEACNGVHPLEDLTYKPPAVFAKNALIIGNSESASLTPEGDSWLKQNVPDYRLIGRRRN